MGGEAVAQRVGRHALLNAGGFRRLVDGAVELAGRDAIERAPSRKQPAVGPRDAAAPALTPPQPKQLQ